MILCLRWSFVQQKYPSYTETSQTSPFESAQRRLRGRRAAIGGGGKKGPLILMAEKGEHERAPSVGESYPTPLRATLRAPPAKWAIRAFFPESPCRVLSLVLSFASKESTAPSGRQPHHPRRSRRVNLPGRDFLQSCRTIMRTWAFLCTNHRRGPPSHKEPQPLTFTSEVW